MCVNNKYITRRNFRYLVYSRKVCVPCGECPECVEKKARDLYVRARMEYQHCFDNGGNGFMCCLTYSDDLLPTCDMGDLGVKMVFNKKDVILFIKRLRVNLDRMYQKMYKQDAPDFKYLVTSEYGSDPTRSHRPHYHMLVFFHDPVSPSAFEECFEKSLYDNNSKEKKYYFGYIMQCDLIDPKRGGIQYSAKYVCKDIMYKPQRDYIVEQIKLKKDMVNKKHGIIYPCRSAEDDFHNSCIRSSKAYKQDVEEYVRPYRHMLQFYMCSNDLGGTCVVEKYGAGLVRMPLINFDGFPYALPKIVKDKFERKYGYAKKQELVKFCFLNYLNRSLNQLIFDKKISSDEAQDLRVFAYSYCQPYKGQIKLVLPSFDALQDALSPVKKWSDIINEFRFYDDNDFFVMRDRLQHILKMINSEEYSQFRFNKAIEKQEKKKKEYEQKKRNKNV